MAGVTALMLLSSFIYHFIMVFFEGREQEYIHSLQVVIESYTGTGYGSDAPWETTIANVFVSIMDMSTFLVLFVVVPYVFRPVLEKALSLTPPSSVDKSGHIVVCGVEQQGRRLIDEFEERGADYVVVVEEKETTLELREEEIPVVFGDLTSAEKYENACVGEASTAVVDTEKAGSVSALLAVREINEGIRTVVLVESLEHEKHLKYAGADQVLTPRHLLGQRIAERITTEVSPTRSDSISLGDDFSILELTVFEDSPIQGKSIEEIEEMTGGTVNVIGMWEDGGFEESPAGDTVIDQKTDLLVAGKEPDVRYLETETYSARDSEPRVVIAGYGVVGSTVRRYLGHSNAEPVVVDIEDREKVDIVGDVTREETLHMAGVEDAIIFVAAIRDDDEAILSVLLADEIASDIDIIARMNDGSNEAKARRAGADYVLSLSEMSGRVLAKEVLHEEILSYGRQFRTVRIDAEPFAGQTLEDADINDGYIVVAIERGGDLVTDFSPELEINKYDSILVIEIEETQIE